MRLELRVTAFVLAAIGFVGIYTPVEAQVAPNNNSVLILGSTVRRPGLLGVSLEEAKAVELGYTVVIDSDAAWRVRSAFDFASFRAIILGDRSCSTFFTTSPDLDAALANRTVWGSAITGNVVAVGTDPTFHSSYFRGLASQGDVVTKSGIAFAAAEDGKTGAYITLSCYYDQTAPGTPVPILDPFGNFTVTGVGSCYNDAHIVAVHDALTGLTDAALSNWTCSVHEAFDSFPSDFLPLAIAKNIGCPSPPGLNFGDGTCGTPYILARGEGLRPVAACGNGTLEAGEECDDRNTDNGDGCSAQCTVEIPTGPVCGDGVLDAGEQCDDGNTVRDRAKLNPVKWAQF